MDHLWTWILIGVAIVLIIVIILIVASFTIGRYTAKQQPKDGVKMTTKKAKVSSKGETECRRVLEKYYGVPFPNVRPDWLRNKDTGRKLELDCYNADLRIAVEYDGKQHFKPCNFGDHDGSKAQQEVNAKENLKAQKKRDKMKDDICRENGVLLIRVPYTIKLEDIEAYLIARLPRKSRCDLL